MFVNVNNAELFEIPPVFGRGGERARTFEVGELDFGSEENERVSWGMRWAREGQREGGRV